MEKMMMEMNKKALEKVSGGCIFFHTWRYTRNKRKKFEKDDLIQSCSLIYEYERRCADCGATEWTTAH